MSTVVDAWMFDLITVHYKRLDKKTAIENTGIVSE